LKKRGPLRAFLGRAAAVEGDRVMMLIGTARIRNTGRLLAVALAVSACSALSQAMADPMIVQGATTFNRRVFEPHEAAIEAASGQQLTVIPNRTMLGIIALLEGRAHMAMLSAPLSSEVKKLKQVMPGLEYGRLKEFDVASTRVAFVGHPSNPVRAASLAQLKKVLTGEITNWSALGGKNAPIRLAFVGGGGGVITTVEASLLDGKSVNAPNILYVKTAVQLVQIVEQEPNVLGIAQLSLAKQKGLPEIVTDQPVEQTLSLVTLGEPTPAMEAVIKAARQAVADSM
jgi:phosphate transport system substrate-binding protein